MRAASVLKRVCCTVRRGTIVRLTNSAAASVGGDAVPAAGTLAPLVQEGRFSELQLEHDAEHGAWTHGTLLQAGAPIMYADV